MAIDIDMESFGRSSAPAAAVQPVDTNSYVEEQGYEAPLEVQPPQEEFVNPQAENFRALREEIDRIKAEKDSASVDRDWET